MESLSSNSIPLLIFFKDLFIFFLLFSVTLQDDKLTRPCIIWENLLKFVKVIRSKINGSTVVLFLDICFCMKWLEICIAHLFFCTNPISAQFFLIKLCSHWSSVYSISRRKLWINSIFSTRQTSKNECNWGYIWNWGIFRQTGESRKYSWVSGI